MSRLRAFDLLRRGNRLQGVSARYFWYSAKDAARSGYGSFVTGSRGAAAHFVESRPFPDGIGACSIVSFQSEMVGQLARLRRPRRARSRCLRAAGAFPSRVKPFILPMHGVHAILWELS